MREFGRAFAQSICKTGQNPGSAARVIALSGELGAGKTQFAKGFARGLGIRQTVNSPTFVICRSYKISAKNKDSGAGFEKFFHIDCYRLQSSRDLAGLDLKKILADKKNLVIIEWPGLVKKILPRDTLWMDFESAGKNIRRVTF